MANSPTVSPRTEAAPPVASHVAVAVLVVLLGYTFWRGSVAPIHYADTWSHFKYGEWIWRHGELPTEEPFTIYADRDSRIAYPGWLSQVLGYLAYSNGGLEGFAIAYAALETLKVALYALVFWRATGSLPLAVAGVVLLLAGRWIYFGVQRPQALAELCWVAVLLVCARAVAGPAAPKTTGGRVWPVWGLAVVPLATALWANLHGAFPLAILVVAICVGGYVLDRLRGRRLPAVLREPEVRRAALTLALAVAGACVNPQGVESLREVARFSRTDSLQFVTEWLPVTPLGGMLGWSLAVSYLLVLATLRLSPARFTPTQVVLLLVFGLGAWFTQRTIFFWEPICLLVLLPHWAVFVRDLGRERQRADWGRSSRLGNVVVAGAGVVAVAFVLASPSARWLFAGQARPVEAHVSAQTPLEAAALLRERGGPPLRIFCAPTWSEYLLWSLPPTDQLYWYNHWHTFSAQRMGDGGRLEQFLDDPHGWRDVVRRYRINAIAIANEPRSERLFDYLRNQRGQPDAEWKVELIEATRPGQPSPAGLVAWRVADPFVQALAAAQAGQGAVGSLGGDPLACSWSFLTHLGWYWPAGSSADRP